MQLRFLILCVSVLISPLAHGTTGSELLLHCQEVETSTASKPTRRPYSAGVCLGMVEGVSQTMESANTSLPRELQTCFPQERLTGIQATLIVLKYLRANPEELHESASQLAFLAFHEAFPCSK